MAATVPFDMLAEIQGWAPAGGGVRSDWRQRDALEPGDLMRERGAWAVIVAHGEAVTTNAAGEILDKSPAIAWRDLCGDTGTRILWSSQGAEVRTDTRIDPATIPAP